MKDTNRKYCLFVEDNCQEIAEKVNRTFEERKEELYKELIKILQDTLEDGNLVHYEWSPYSENGEYWDHSGSLQESGKIDLTQTVEDFLEYEYTGNWSPSYESGRGKNYDCYGNSLSYDTNEIGGDVMREVITDVLVKEFPELSRDDCDDIIFDTFDSIYDNCYARDFFFAEGAYEYVGLSKKSLQEIMEENADETEDA